MERDLHKRHGVGPRRIADGKRPNQSQGRGALAENFLGARHCWRVPDGMTKRECLRVRRGPGTEVEVQ
jgi:hypothetical protein